MEIRAAPGFDTWLWVDGQAVTVGVESGMWHQVEMSGHLIRFKESSPNGREAIFYYSGGKRHIVFKTFKSFVRIDVNWENSSESFKGSLGLLGSFDQSGLRVARDGVTPIQDANQFGQEWQVLATEPQLFHSYEDAVVGRKCVMPPAYSPEKAASMKRRLRTAGLTQSMAEKACQHLQDPDEIKACVFDVLSTQDLSMASAW